MHFHKVENPGLPVSSTTETQSEDRSTFKHSQRTTTQHASAAHQRSILRSHDQQSIQGEGFNWVLETARASRAATGRQQSSNFREAEAHVSRVKLRAPVEVGTIDKRRTLLRLENS